MHTPPPAEGETHHCPYCGENNTTFRYDEAVMHYVIDCPDCPDTFDLDGFTRRQALNVWRHGHERGHRGWEETDKKRKAKAEKNQGSLF